MYEELDITKFYGSAHNFILLYGKSIRTVGSKTVLEKEVFWLQSYFIW